MRYSSYKMLLSKSLKLPYTSTESFFQDFVKTLHYKDQLALDSKEVMQSNERHVHMIFPGVDLGYCQPLQNKALSIDIQKVVTSYNTSGMSEN